MPQQSKPDDGAPPSSILVYLSLFLLLLAFFILLNAISVQEKQRVRAVLESVERVFTIDPRLLFGHHPVSARAGSVVVTAGLKTLGDLFETEIAVAKVTRISPGNILEVVMPADNVFVRDGSAVRPERAGLLDRVAESLRQRPPGLRYVAEVLVSVPAPEGTDPAAAARATAFARALVERGAPASALSAGLEPGAAGWLRLLFTVHTVDDPRGDAADASDSPAPAH